MFWTSVRRASWGMTLGLVCIGSLESCGSDGGAEDGTSGADGSGASSNGSGASSTGSGASSNGSGASSNGSGASSNGDGGSIGSGTGGSSLGLGGNGEGGGDSECGDGVDNDGDGHTDYAFDPGCYGPWDATEAAGSRAEENGFTTFEFADDSVVVYVSADGDDGEDGATPETAVQTLARANGIVRDGEHDFIRLRRGDTWRDETLGRFKSGRDAAHPIVIGSYGESLQLPRLEIADDFIDHNGQARDFVALLDLHLINYAKDPADPAFDGATGASLRYIGGGANLLVEGCHFEYVEIQVQSTIDGAPYVDVQFRANVIEKAYHEDTCTAGDPNGNSTYRPSGIYSSHVNGLLLEGNLFDHNGWNEDVDSACATIYNHNVYLNGHDVVIRDNVFSRSSSIHIKLRSDAAGEMTGTRIYGNFFSEGEVGVSIGGNGEEADRFVDSEIVDNVFSDVGRSQPTTRNIAYGVEVIDTDGLLLRGNYFLNQWAGSVTNSYAVSIADGSARDVSIQENLFYRIQNRGLITHVSSGHDGITVFGNAFIDPDQGSRLVIQDGPFAAYAYSDNRYHSSANPNAWMGTEGGNVGMDEWMNASGEVDAEELATVPDFADPDRTIETYAQSLQLGDSLEAYLAQARLQSRLRYSYELSAPAVTGYIRAGFEE